jgi:Ca2+-binding EF-hand superfamily protein
MLTSIHPALSRVDTLFARLDTGNKGYLEKADLQAALPGNPAKRSTEPADKLFARLDGDQDGKVSKSELSDALGKVSDQLYSQLNQSRVGLPPPPPPDPSPPRDVGIDPADANADGKVSEDEAAEYAAQHPSAPTTAGSAGVSKSQLSEQSDALPATDVRRQAALNKLVDNFEQADANADGKLSRSEGRDYLKANRPDGGRQDSGFAAFARALQSLKSYQIEPPDNPAPVDTSV